LAAEPGFKGSRSFGIYALLLVAADHGHNGPDSASVVDRALRTLLAEIVVDAPVAPLEIIAQAEVGE
jgi:hypothetical protein